MPIINIRLCDADWRQLGLACGKLSLDLEALKDLDYDAYQAIEADMATPLAVFLPTFESATPGGLGQATVKRVATFVALRLAGHDVAWDDCKPKPGRTEIERQEDTPAGPPAGPSERSSEDAPPASS